MLDETPVAPPAPARPSRRAQLRTTGEAASGFLDAGLAALSTFLMGTAVVRLLPTADLALYSSMFAAFVLCALLPTQLVYVPSQLAANVESGLLGRPLAPDLVDDLKRHLPVVLLAPVVACLLGLPLAAEAGWPTYWFGVAGLFLFTIGSPHQSHARSVLHVAGLHSGAAAVSATTLVVQAVLLAAPVLLAGSAATSPAALGAVFAGVGIANAAGTVLAIVLLQRVERSPANTTPIRVRIGFLASEAVGQGAGYLAILVVAAVLGTTAVAHLEAARVIASPMQILVVGLLAFLLPRAVRAVAVDDHPAFRRIQRITVAVVTGAGLLYGAAVLLAGGLIGRVLERPVNGGLAALRVAATTVDSLAAAPGMALFARQRITVGLVVMIVANSVQLVTLPFTLLLFGQAGMPASQILGAGVKTVALGRVAKGLFAADPAR